MLDSYWIRLLIIVLILALAALFTLLEYAVVKVRPSELKDMPQTKTVQKAEHMVNNLSEYLSTAQVGVTMTSLILGWIGDTYITDLLLMIDVIPADVRKVVAPIVGVLIFTFFHAVFTDLVPKNMAIDRPVPILLAIVHPIQFFHWIFYPFVWLFAVVAGKLTKALGFNVQPEEDTYSQNEIMTLSKQSEKAGAMDEEDILFMRRAFEMNDKVAADIMIDRTQLEVIDRTAKIKEAAQLYFNKRFTRYPVVANNDKDHVVGYIFAYDIMRQNQINPESSIRDIIRKIPTVYEGEDLTDVLKKMERKGAPICLVQDEYGGTSGIVTDKDIYEEMFGDVREEIDHINGDMIEKDGTDNRGNMIYRVSGKTNLGDFERYFDVDIPQFEDLDVATLNGFFLEEEYSLKLNHPLRVGNFSFIPVEMENSNVKEFRVTQIKPKDQSKANNSEDKVEK
ncbi:hemolysin family protein [Lactobacillus sp. 3B(2020)]|uniref:hemolysin family protein n=1 Tax=Lactobacillus sp. 3B(2020) TaxID=2695882 RepID=UPI0015DD5A90|nr:hemolysin family protein [Lactobacillus sp. 3B(2020)]QLL69941.1 DUF21 domain-containing protein [Lactobacillus sp. 3B(2020)]